MKTVETNDKTKKACKHRGDVLTNLIISQLLSVLEFQKVSEYDQKIPKSHTADQPTVP